MRMPRVRFTIRRIMVVILLIGLTLGGVLFFNQIVNERRAKASYQQAKLVREVAEYAVKEYKEGIYLQDKATYQGQIALAQSDLERAFDRLKWSSEMLARGKHSAATITADRLTLTQSQFNLEQARTQLDVLEKYTKDKQLKALSSDVEKARVEEQAKLRIYQMIRSKRWGSGS